MIHEASDPIKTSEWILKAYKVDAVMNLTSEQIKHVVTLLKQKAQKSQNENPKS